MIYQVIANFSATWCGPCRILAPFYCELSEKHPSLMFLLIDVDELTVSIETSICHLPLYIRISCLFLYALYSFSFASSDYMGGLLYGLYPHNLLFGTVSGIVLSTALPYCIKTKFSSTYMNYSHSLNYQ